VSQGSGTAPVTHGKKRKALSLSSHCLKAFPAVADDDNDKFFLGGWGCAKGATDIVQSFLTSRKLKKKHSIFFQKKTVCDNNLQC
jgi:hypothetical protein